MSLKDRLNSQTKAVLNIEKTDNEPIYYHTSEISQGVDSLGEIDTLFADDEINSIHVLGAKNIYIERKGKKSKISLTYRDNIRLENIIRKNAQFHGLEFDEEHPFIEFNHKPGINILATLPPLSSAASMIIKCYKDKFASLKTLSEYQAMSKEVALLIEALASLKLNIIIAGEKNTLKTTLLSAIAKKIPQNNNAIVIDYSKELKFDNNNIITYDFKNYDNKNLIDYIISSNPDKLFLNDCTDLSYFEDYLKKGYKGLCANINAKDSFDALNKINKELFDILIFVERKDSKRLVSSVSYIDKGEIKNIFYINEDLKHCSTGFIPDFYGEIEQSGLGFSNAVFETEYKHTYYQTIQNDVLASALKKNLNTAILKKFKKDVKTDKQEENIEETPTEDTENIIEQENNEQNL